jgi:hypothetical protein
MGSRSELEMVMRRTLVLAMLVSTATLALECNAIGAETCDGLWQRISADSKISSAVDKAKAMEQQGKACMDKNQRGQGRILFSASNQALRLAPIHSNGGETARLTKYNA